MSHLFSPATPQDRLHRTRVTILLGVLLASSAFSAGCDDDAPTRRSAGAPRDSSSSSERTTSDSSASSDAAANSSSIPPAEKDPSTYLGMENPTPAPHTPDPSAITARSVPSTEFGEFVQRVTLRRAGAPPISGLSAAPQGTPKGCILMLHGLAASAEGTWPVGLLLIGAGYRVFSMDARDQGINTVVGSEVTKSPESLANATRGTIVDAQWALDWLGTQPGCNPDHLGFLGISFGGITGSILSSVEPRLTAPMLLVAGADFRTIFSTSSAGVFQDWTRDDLDGAVAAFADLEPAEALTGSTNQTPILMINGTNDTVITPQAATKLHEAAGERGKVVWFNGGHGLEDFIQGVVLVNALGEWGEQHGQLLLPETDS